MAQAEAIELFQLAQAELFQLAQAEAIETRRFFQLVDSGATVHIVPDYIISPSADATAPVIDLDDFISDDVEPFEPPPCGPAAWFAPSAPQPPAPVEPVLNRYTVLSVAWKKYVEPPPCGPARWAPTADQVTMLPRTYGLRS